MTSRSVGNFHTQSFAHLLPSLSPSTLIAAVDVGNHELRNALRPRLDQLAVAGQRLYQSIRLARPIALDDVPDFAGYRSKLGVVS